MIESSTTSYNNVEIRVTASFGVAFFMPTMQDYPGLVHAADSALYRAKDNGRNCVEAHAMAVETR